MQQWSRKEAMRSQNTVPLEKVTPEQMSPVPEAAQSELHAAVVRIADWFNNAPYNVAAQPDADLSGTGVLLIATLTYRGALHPFELSEILHTGRSNISKVVATLEQAGLVVRVADANDSRALLVALTDAGRAIGAKRAQLGNTLMSLPDWDPAEVAELTRLLHKLEQHLENQAHH
jgi:DNA-binding MarR family transcriptional regulator